MSNRNRKIHSNLLLHTDSISRYIYTYAGHIVATVNMHKTNATEIKNLTCTCVNATHNSLFCDKIFPRNTHSVFTCTRCGTHYDSIPSCSIEKTHKNYHKKHTHDATCYTYIEPGSEIPFCPLCKQYAALDRNATQNISTGFIHLAYPVPHPWHVKRKSILKIFSLPSQAWLSKKISNTNEYGTYHTDTTSSMWIEPALYEKMFEYYITLFPENVYALIKENHVIAPIAVDTRTRKKFVQTLYKAIEVDPTLYFITKLPVLSPTYRPIISLENTLAVKSEINIIYEQILLLNGYVREIMHYGHKLFFSSLTSIYRADIHNTSEMPLRDVLQRYETIMEYCVQNTVSELDKIFDPEKIKNREVEDNALMLLSRKITETTDITKLIQTLHQKRDELRNLVYRVIDVGLTISRKPSNAVSLTKYGQDLAKIREEEEQYQQEKQLRKKKYSILQRLVGKQGRFRKDILGKRIDYSGRTVIASGPSLALNQCGLPYLLAIQVYEPILKYHLEKLFRTDSKLRVFAKKTDSISEMVEHLTITDKARLRSYIENIIAEHPILLNRAPTLHRYNIQAFEPILIDQKAIYINPLVCASFNADFDGDTMAVYVPNTLISQIEARLILLTTNTLYSLATYEIMIAPSKDIVFGLYYLTLMHEDVIHTYAQEQDILRALEFGIITIHTCVMYGDIKTTPGRMLLYTTLRNYVKELTIQRVNRVFDKKEIESFINEFYIKSAQILPIVLEELMYLGFGYAYQAGISLHKDDVYTSTFKNQYIDTINRNIIEQTRKEQLLSDKGVLEEAKQGKKQTIITTWIRCTAFVTKELVREVVETIPTQRSALYMLVHSGARGSVTQVRQLSGMRGLMLKPSGDILETPITSNFKDGLNALEYFNSTHGARKGVIDTAFKTAVAGYLTRKLFYAARDLYISSQDCGTTRGIVLGNPFYSSYGSTTKTIYKDALGRYLLHDVVNPYTNIKLIEKNTLLLDSHIEILRQNAIETIIIRSPITCKNAHTHIMFGICQKCYGSTDRIHLPSLGHPVGVIAAQSIGEPGTQLTMRTFHLGGTLSKGEDDFSYCSTGIYRVFILNHKTVCTTSSHSIGICTSLHTKLVLFNTQDHTIAVTKGVPFGAKILISDGSIVMKNVLLYTYDPFTRPIMTMTESFSMFRQTYGVGTTKKNKRQHQYCAEAHINTYEKETHGQNKDVKIYSWFTPHIHTTWKTVIGLDTGLVHKYILTGDNISWSVHMKKQPKGQVGLAIGNKSVTQDIIGGLSKIARLFECVPTSAIVAPANGIIIFSKRRTSYFITLLLLSYDRIHNTRKLIRIATIHNTSTLFVREYDYVYEGDILSEGIIPIKDMAEKGYYQSSLYRLLDEIQSVYLENGVYIQAKHIESIISRLYTKRICWSQRKIDILMKIREKDKEKYKKESLVTNHASESHIERLPYTSAKYLTLYNTKYIYTHKTNSRKNSAIDQPYNTYRDTYMNTYQAVHGISASAYESHSVLSGASFQKPAKKLISILTVAQEKINEYQTKNEGTQTPLFFGSLLPYGTGIIELNTMNKG